MNNNHLHLFNLPITQNNGKNHLELSLEERERPELWSKPEFVEALIVFYAEMVLHDKDYMDTLAKALAQRGTGQDLREVIFAEFRQMISLVASQEIEPTLFISREEFIDLLDEDKLLELIYNIGDSFVRPIYIGNEEDDPTTREILFLFGKYTGNEERLLLSEIVNPSMLMGTIATQVRAMVVGNLSGSQRVETRNLMYYSMYTFPGMKDIKVEVSQARILRDLSYPIVVQFLGESGKEQKTLMIQSQIAFVGLLPFAEKLLGATVTFFGSMGYRSPHIDKPLIKAVSLEDIRKDQIRKLNEEASSEV